MVAGGSLLLYVGSSWFLAQQLPAVIEHAPRSNSTLANLPPALAPAVDRPQTADSEEPRAIAPIFALTEGEIAALLPQSPVAEGKTAESETAPEPAPPAGPAQPLRILIPALGIDAPIERARLQEKQSSGRAYTQWSVPNNFAAGWHETSAPIGQPGNTVLNGHNNVHDAIFGDLTQLAVGEQIVLVGDGLAVAYRVIHHELLKEEGVPLRERVRNARWIAETDDERLTLVTCWPNTTNSHRLIVVAEPVEKVQ